MTPGPMNMARRRAINKMKEHVNEKLQNVEVTELKAGTLAEEVKEAINKPNMKMPKP